MQGENASNEVTGGSWYNYLTPPRRNGKRQRSTMETSAAVSPLLLATPLDDDDVILSPTSDDVELQTTTTPSIVAKEEEESPKKRTGLFRRLRNRRLLRVDAAAAPATTTPALVSVSPPVSGNSQFSSRSASSSPRQRHLIPADHPMKLLWDVLTVLLSIANAYMTHIAIRDRKFDAGSIFKTMTEVWLVVDILLNFVTERAVGNVTLRTVSAVSARYLTTWFVVDVLSLLPGEVLFVKPVIEQQNARRFLKKWALRTRAVTRVVTRLLRRWTYVRSVAKHSHHVGGVARVTKLCIKYIPKYVLFLRHMKAVIGFRLLRQYHWMRRLTKKHEKFNENKTVEEDDDTWPDEFEYYEDATDDPETTTLEQQQQQQRVMVFEYDDFDDGDPY